MAYAEQIVCLVAPFLGLFECVLVYASRISHSCHGELRIARILGQSVPIVMMNLQLPMLYFPTIGLKR